MNTLVLSFKQHLATIVCMFLKATTFSIIFKLILVI